MQIYAENRKAHFDYEILQAYEAGIVLRGFEVKAAKAGKIHIAGSYVISKGDGLYLVGATIEPYQANNTPEGYDPGANRRLLLKEDEIKELIGRAKNDRLTIVPTKVYNKRGLVKVEIALARSKKKKDKRETIRKRETQREMDRTLKR